MKTTVVAGSKPVETGAENPPAPEDRRKLEHKLVRELKFYDTTNSQIPQN